MEFLESYMSELVVGTSTTIGGFVVAVLKAFGSRVKRLEDEIHELRRDLEINTALDKERAKRDN